MKRLFVFLFLIPTAFIHCAFGASCEVVDATGNRQLREQILSNENLPGVRIGLGGIKDANTAHGLGKVNKAMSGYEKSICKTLAKSMGEGNTAVKVSIIKTDYKGYYMTCEPMPGCLEKSVSQIKGELPKIPGGSAQLNVSMVTARNYPEGYVQSRFVNAYPEASGSVVDFANKELKEAAQEANGVGNRAQLPEADEEFLKKIKANAEKYRTLGEEAVDKDFRRLVKALDVLVETPYFYSENIEKQLESALHHNGKLNMGGYNLSAAQTGDDLFFVVRSGGEVKRVLGADARGLGVENFLARYQELAQDLNKGNEITGLKDLLDLSTRSMKRADRLMDDSFALYQHLLVKGISRREEGVSLDDVFASVHKEYNEVAKNRQGLMEIRAGAIGNCGEKPKEILNRISAIHNGLKTLEKAGVDGVFGQSCLGVEHLILKHGLDT